MLIPVNGARCLVRLEIDLAAHAIPIFLNSSLFPRAPRLAHDIPRRIPVSPWTRCLPARAALRTCTLERRVRPLPHPVAHRREYGDSVPPRARSPCRRRRATPRTCTSERRPRTPHRGRLALALAVHRASADFAPDSPPANWDDTRRMSVRIGARAEADTERAMTLALT
ncbi:hypothetical protein DFH09DRAFT_1343304 [Mycena vulgaris]|nr:hypothetical protein DFH09DRAFT_1343304 [Mycena vulgaris]